MKTIIFLSLAAFLAGCASVPDASPELERRARNLSPPPGKAAVYVTRIKFAGTGVSFPIGLDYQPFGTIVRGSFIYAEVEPGPHVLRIDWETVSGKVQPHHFTTEAGRLYFFNVEAGLNWIRLDPLDEATGRKCVQDFKVSGNNVWFSRDSK
jgi:hypothetical protein